MDVALTGGIGAGKSLVAAFLRDRGAVVIDLDQVARGCLDPGSPVVLSVRKRFGAEVVDDRGVVDRAALAARVFRDRGARVWLENAVHPEVARRVRQIRSEIPPGTIVVHDIPLLAETGSAGAYDRVVVVDAPDEVRLARLAARGMTREDAVARMSSQVSRRARLALADWVVDNSGSLAELEREVDGLWNWLLTQEREGFRADDAADS